MPSGPYVPRRAGLSRNTKVVPLHAQFRPQQEIGRQRKITEPDDPAAPPISDDSSDDDERDATSRRGDITRTTFQTDAKSNPTQVQRKPAGPSRKSARTAAKPARQESPKRPLESDDDEIEEPTKRLKPAIPQGAYLGSQFTADGLQRRAPVRGYGSQKKNGNGRTAGASSKSLSRLDDVSSPEKAKSRFKPVANLDDALTPEKPKSKPALPDANDFALTPSSSKGYRAHSALQDDPSTPSSVQRFKHTNTEEISPASTPEKRPVRKANAKNSTDQLMKHQHLDRQKKKALKQARLRRQQEMEDNSPEVVKFRLPAGLDSQDDLACESDLDVLIRPQQPEVVLSPVRASLDDNDGPICPMCKEPVEQELLDRFSKKKTMSMTQQQGFCNHHKTKTARQTWIDKDYPNIDWSKLDKRIASHHDFLETIVNGGQSHFGGLFAKSVKAGKNKRLMNMDQNPTPGYYGSRGMRVMNDYIISRFSRLLRKVAVQDRLVSARGHMGFVQFVLVPELAVRLIMEDMDVTAEEARTIMDVSQKVGDLLNEEEDDDIVEDDESDRKSTSSLSSLGDGDLSDDMT